VFEGRIGALTLGHHSLECRHEHRIAGAELRDACSAELARCVQHGVEERLQPSPLIR
jgi:hypothetical protein